MVNYGTKNVIHWIYLGEVKEMKKSTVVFIIGEM